MDAVILGRIGYDLISEEPYVPLSKVRRFVSYLGGSSANIAVGLARLGAKAGVIAALGDDSVSDFLVDFLKSEGVDTARVHRIPGYLPSLALTEIHPPDRFPQVFYRRDPVDTRVKLEEDDFRYAASGRMFLTNGTSLCASPSRESTYRALERAKAAGCTTVLDVDYRAMSWNEPGEAGLAVRLALPLVDMLIGNDTELKLVAGSDSLDDAVDRLIRSGVPMLVSKLGHKGTRVWTGKEFVFLEPYKVEVKSTIGAGDGFASGFLYAFLRGMPVIDCLHYGNAAAAIVVSRLSCSEAMPSLAELEKLMVEQKPA